MTTPDPERAVTTPLAPQGSAVGTLARATIGLVVAFIAVVGVGLWRDVVRAKQVSELSASVSDLTASVANLTAAQRQRDAEVAELGRLANAYALLASTDPAERAAAREELATLAREAAAANQRRSGGAPAPATTRPPSTSQPPPTAPPTTSAPRATTTTTRPCRVHVGPLEVCRP